MSESQLYAQQYAAVGTEPAELPFSPRWQSQWIAFIIPVFINGASWLMGGLPRLTDLGFSVLSGICLIYLISELMHFPRRFGIGGLLLYGGVLVWFSHDYFSHWFLLDFNSFNSPFRPEVVAKAAYYYSLFILCMSFGLRLRGGRLIQRAVLLVPEPGNELFYLILIAILFIIGIAPFFLFTAEPAYMALFHGAFSSWTEPVKWTVGRTGNLNYDWGGYVAQIIQVGEVGGILATAYAVLVCRRLWWSWPLCWCIWAYWVMFVFNGGRRGDLFFMVGPPIAFFFLKYQMKVTQAMRRVSVKAYLIVGVLAFALLVAVQLEGTFRGAGLATADLSQIDLTKNQGNSMFSEGLIGYAMIPDRHDFFADSFPGEGLILPMPQELFYFMIGPIPRALWNSKPIDPLWEWYNQIVTGDTSGKVGTTISKGLVGSFYFHYGFCGVLEGGILLGWLMAISERCLQNSKGPMGILMSLGFAVWLFRSFRDFYFVELYEFMVGALVLYLLILALRPFLGGTSPSAAPEARGGMQPAVAG